MTNSELIERLKKLPPDAQVIFPCLADGGGYEYVNGVRMIKVIRYPGGGGSYYGPLDDYTEARKDSYGTKPINAILIDS
jgi:hypothetical protein